MNRAYTVVAIAVLVLLAGCGGTTGETGDGGPTTTDSSSGGAASPSTGTTGETGSGGATDPGSTGGAANELTMLQFDQVERYEYETVDAMGKSGNLTVLVNPTGDGEVTLELNYSAGSYSTNPRYIVPAGDDESVIDVLQGSERDVAVFFVAQSQDVTGIYTSQGLPWEIGSDVEQLGLRVNVTGRDTVAGVDCLTYELTSVENGALVESGCITSDLEMPVQWTKYLEDGRDADATVRSSMTLVAYEQG